MAIKKKEMGLDSIKSKFSTKTKLVPPDPQEELPADAYDEKGKIKEEFYKYVKQLFLFRNLIKINIGIN
jgi:hypothetical protein